MPDQEAGCADCIMGPSCSHRTGTEEDLIIPYIVCTPHYAHLSRDCCITFGQNNESSCFVDPSEIETRVDSTKLIKAHDIRAIGDKIWVVLRDAKLEGFFEFLVSPQDMYYQFISPAELEEGAGNK
ncbi:hypothetical protein FJZ17_03345 [Candidatus Pacearchaeota archaeon]|nr:hypothetical protein [Candidatus Pacearchaeota archaeon]